MKAIIIAAGQGNRLMPHTNDKPKCLLDVGGKTIFQRQLEVLRQCNINEISVVRGYKKELISYPDIKYYENTDYENNNILRSLFYAEDEMDDEFVFSYSDILFKTSVLEKMLRSKGDISIVVDVDWIRHYEGRTLHPIQEAELVMVENGKVTGIGKDVVIPKEAHGEFIGLAKFSRNRAGILKSNYQRVVREYRGKQFQKAASLDKAYLTDMIQELIDRNYPVHSVDITGDWIEIDTSQDLERARLWLRAT